jgi:hypothetical protein
MGPHDVQVASNWREVMRPSMRPQRHDRVREVLFVLLSPVLLTTGIALGFDYGDAWAHFHRAHRVSAVVVDAEYGKPELRTGAYRITLILRTTEGQVQATVDDPVSAPDGLTEHEKVSVLYDVDRPGHALFPSQLGWGAAVFPSFLVCAGAGGITIGVIKVVRRLWS